MGEKWQLCGYVGVVFSMFNSCRLHHLFPDVSAGSGGLDSPLATQYFVSKVRPAPATPAPAPRDGWFGRSKLTCLCIILLHVLPHRWDTNIAWLPSTPRSISVSGRIISQCCQA